MKRKVIVQEIVALGAVVIGVAALFMGMENVALASLAGLLATLRSNSNPAAQEGGVNA